MFEANLNLLICPVHSLVDIANRRLHVIIYISNDFRWAAVLDSLPKLIAKKN